MTEVNTALVVGCGSIGARHARNLDSLRVKVSLFDVDAARASALAEELNATAYASLQEGIDNNPDIVIIATPTGHHINPALTAARSGCDLFVEKPLSYTKEGVEELLEAVERNSCISMIGCNLRFHPAIKRIKELVQGARVGDLISAQITGGSYLPEWNPDTDYRNRYSAKAEVGGALLDWIHELNYARWLFGEPTIVSALLGFESSLEIDSEDTASLLTEFESGTICQIHLDYVQRPYTRSCRIIGESGTIVWRWSESTVRRYDPDDRGWKTEERYPDWEINDMYIEMMSHFIECVESRSSPTSSLTDGWRDLEFVLAAKKSHERGTHIEL